MAQSIFTNIEHQLDTLPQSEEETRFVLESARRKLIDFVDNGSYIPDTHSIGITDAVLTNEVLAESFTQAEVVFSFVRTFSVGEFVAFMEAHAEFLKMKTKRKRGRPRKTEDDRAKEKAKFAQQITSCFNGLRFNSMTNEYQYLKADRKGRLYYYSTSGDDLNLLSTKLSLEHGISIPADEATKIFKYLALENKYAPQVDLLNQARSRFPDMTPKEATEFLSGLGEQLFGVFPEEPVVNGLSLRNEAIKRFFVAMANLARNPGDIPFWMPLLIGGQGCGKSAFCKFIIPQEFASLAAEVKTSIQKLADEAYRLHVAFLLEFPEIDAQMNSKTTEWMKNLVTTSEDLCRRPYSPEPIRLVRQFGLIGTTNREDLFNDATGERRYVPIQIQHGHEVPWRSLVNIDLATNEGTATDFTWKIWAAADIAAQSFSGDQVQLRAWTREELETLASFQSRYQQSDLWETKVLNFTRLASGRRFTTPQLLENIGIDLGKTSSTSANRRVNDIITRHFGSAAKKVQITLEDGRRVRGWEIVQDITPEISVASRVQDLSDVKLNNPESDF
jgi:predicted P-loop ATPase